MPKQSGASLAVSPLIRQPIERAVDAFLRGRSARPWSQRARSGQFASLL